MLIATPAGQYVEFNVLLERYQPAVYIQIERIETDAQAKNSLFIRDHTVSICNSVLHFDIVHVATYCRLIL